MVLPLVLNQLPRWLGIPISTALASHLELMIFGALIVFFLIVEPHGLARLWAIGKAEAAALAVPALTTSPHVTTTRRRGDMKCT